MNKEHEKWKQLFGESHVDAFIRKYPDGTLKDFIEYINNLPINHKEEEVFPH